MAGILDVCLRIFYSLSAAGSSLLDFLNRSFNIPGSGDYSLLDVLFGVGLTVYFGYAIIKFLIPTS